MEWRIVEHGSPEYDAEVDLRYRVLRAPLGLAFSSVQLAAEVSDLHLGAFESGALIGCLVLTPISSEVVQMRQLAVEPAHQGKGVGRFLVETSEALAVERGFREMMLHARESAVPFYLKLCYSVRGAPFEEVTIPHREMFKVLAPSE